MHDQIVTALKSEEGAKQASAVGKRVLEGLRRGDDLTALTRDVAEKYSADSTEPTVLRWSESKTLTREVPAGVPGVVAKLVFRIAAPSGEKVNYEGAALPSGAFAIVGLTEVSQAAPATDGEMNEQRARVVHELQVGRGEQAFSAVRKSVRRRAKIIIKQQNLRPDEG